jgi:hypothetical protein
VTISASRTNELNIDGICRQAYRLAGLMGADMTLGGAVLADLKVQLDLIVKGLAVHGLHEKVMDFEDVTLVTDDDTYSLSASTLDAVGVGTVVDEGTIVSPCTREVLLVLQQGEGSGPPSHYFVDRSTTPISVVLYPPPSADQNGQVLRFQVHVLRADSTGGTDTADVERYFQQYLVWELGHWAAVSGGRDASSCGYLRSQAEKMLEKCKPAAKPSGHGTITLCMPTQWSR